MSVPILTGVNADELEATQQPFINAISTLLRDGHRYEAILCGMSMALGTLAADRPPNDFDPDDEYHTDSMALIMQAVKDIVAEREPQEPAPTPPAETPTERT